MTPIEIQLTDDLIDQIVYKLYGLTEEEIAIVEGQAQEQSVSAISVQLSALPSGSYVSSAWSRYVAFYMHWATYSSVNVSD
mgnify:CR=1 FL=1